MAVMLNARSRVRKSELLRLKPPCPKEKARRAERARFKAETRDIARRYM